MCCSPGSPRLGRRSAAAGGALLVTSEISLHRYRRLWILTVLITSVVTVSALLVLNGVNYHQFERTLEAESMLEVEVMLDLTGQSVTRSLDERLASLRLLVRTRSFDELSDRKTLSSLLKALRSSYGEFAGLSLRAGNGEPAIAVGGTVPDLGGEESVGEVVSILNEGYRFALSVRSEDDEGHSFRLTAAVDAHLLAELAEERDEDLPIFTFLVNRQSVLQTPSRYCGGEVLEPCVRELPRIDDRSAVFKDLDRDGYRLFWGHSQVPDSPFTVVVLLQPSLGARSYFQLRGELLLITIGSAALLLLLNVGTATWLILKIREADVHQAQMLHKAQYTTKMASLGRLAAGVAHEINNPLAIINEKAGLVKDLAGLVKEEFPRREKVVANLDSILHSVERCRAITHRLLGFARRMDVDREPVMVDLLLTQVLSFLETEALHREVEIVKEFPEEQIRIESDRGQLQQVFLNILNNAFEATPDGGTISLGVKAEGDDSVVVTVRDTGHGIDSADVKHIFEPFYTTKGKYGTGLGLSITYGIVTNLGGDIRVESELGVGTCFTIVLPLGPAPGGGGGE